MLRHPTDVTWQVTIRGMSKARQTTQMPQHGMHTPTNCSCSDSIIWYLFFSQKILSPVLEIGQDWAQPIHPH